MNRWAILGPSEQDEGPKLVPETYLIEGCDISWGGLYHSDALRAQRNGCVENVPG